MSYLTAASTNTLTPTKWCVMLLLWHYDSTWYIGIPIRKILCRRRRSCRSHRHVWYCPIYVFVYVFWCVVVGEYVSFSITFTTYDDTRSMYFNRYNGSSVKVGVRWMNECIFIWYLYKIDISIYISVGVCVCLGVLETRQKQKNGGDWDIR